MKINTCLDFQGNEIKLATPEKVSALPESNLFVGRVCILISEKEVDETTISVGSIYYYNGEQWSNIEGESLEIDETKINVIDDEIIVHTFDTISSAVTYIKSNDIKPKSVIIGSNAGVASIGNEAFGGCKSITSIYIPSGVTSIGGNAFYDCTSLTSVYISAGVTSIGNNAFSGCISLKSINIPGTVTSIGVGAFRFCSSLKSIIKPKGVTSISDNVFEGCTSLTSVAMNGSNITSIGNEAFKNCTSLTSIYMPTGVTSIGTDAFNNCKSLNYITIPNSVTSIGSNAFYNCTSLEGIDIFDRVTGIANNAFTGCDILLLDGYKFREGYPWGATDILIQNENVTTTIDENSTDRQVPTAKTVYDALSSSNGIDNTKINVIEDEITLYTFDTLSDAATYISSDTKPKSVIIGSDAGVTDIDDYAFSDCTALTSVYIPYSVTSIGDSALV